MIGASEAWVEFHNSRHHCKLCGHRVDEHGYDPDELTRFRCAVDGCSCEPFAAGRKRGKPLARKDCPRCGRHAIYWSKKRRRYQVGKGHELCRQCTRTIRDGQRGKQERGEP